MKKILLSISVVASLFATEIEFGKGTFNIDASFLGLDSSQNEDITSISLVNEHSNIFSSKYFFSYKISYFKSNTLTTMFNTANTLTNKVNSLPSDTTNSSSDSTSSDSTSNSDTTSSTNTDIKTYDKLRGLDINFVLGRDFINKDDKDTYLGAGIILGGSFPYIKTSTKNYKSAYDYLNKSKTKFYTYKLGLDLKGSKAINKIISFYASGAYAFQKARVKNDKLNLDSSSSGNYMTFNAGVKFQAKTHTKIWFMNLSPSLFATLGYRYDHWNVNDVKINSLNINTDIKMNISQFYAGIGYDF